MSNWIESKLRYDKIMDNGAVKKVTEHFLVDALSFTEAEARVTDEMKPYISGDFSVAAVKKTKITKIFFNEGPDIFYLVKVNFVTIDERTGVDKKSLSQILVQAADFEDALAKFKEGMKGTMADFEIHSITETPILEVFTVKTESNG